MAMGLLGESHQNPGSTRKCPFRVGLLHEEVIYILIKQFHIARRAAQGFGLT